MYTHIHALQREELKLLQKDVEGRQAEIHEIGKVEDLYVCMYVFMYVYAMPSTRMHVCMYLCMYMQCMYVCI
jgi:hypothetical protein